MTSSQQCKASATAAGWFEWFGVWLNVAPWEALEQHQPPYIIGTARELCLMQGLFTGDTTL